MEVFRKMSKFRPKKPQHSSPLGQKDVADVKGSLDSNYRKTQQFLCSFYLYFVAITKQIGTTFFLVKYNNNSHSEISGREGWLEKRFAIAKFRKFFSFCPFLLTLLYFGLWWLCVTVQLESDRKLGWERGVLTFSKGPQVGFLSWAAAVRAQPLYMGHNLSQLSHVGALLDSFSDVNLHCF